jgi:hypothetical protein
VVGGMFFSTFLTLLLVPVVYTLLARFTAVMKHGKQPAGERSSVVKAADEGELIPEGAEVAK